MDSKWIQKDTLENAMRTALPKRFPILLFILRATAVLHILTFLTDII